MSILTTLQNRLRPSHWQGRLRGITLEGLSRKSPFLSEERVRKRARKLLGFLAREAPYPGEVFLCGGAFKTLMNPQVGVNDLDLWVRNRKERDCLSAFLLARGATLLRDFHPYCMLYQLDDRLVEITYQNVRERPISDIVRGFDIAGCAVAATYRDGEIVDAYFTASAAHSVRLKTACLEMTYLERLRADRLPTVLRTIDRLERFASDVGYPVSEADLAALWRLYREEYSPDERQKCMDVYLETTCGYKGIHNTALLNHAALR